MTSLLLEDEPQLLAQLRHCIDYFPEIQVVGQTDNLDAAFRLFQEFRPQTTFMDINLIGGSAFQLLQRLQRAGIPLPAIVLVSGYPTQAVKALNEFGPYVVHFIEKPYLDGWETTFRQAVDTLIVRTQTSAAAPSNHVFLKTKDAIERVPQQSIVWVEVIGNGKCCAVTDHTDYEINQTLSTFLKSFPEIPLQQCTRDLAVNLNRLVRVETKNHTAILEYRNGEKEFSIGPGYYQSFLDALT